MSSGGNIEATSIEPTSDEDLPSDLNSLFDLVVVLLIDLSTIFSWKTIIKLFPNQSEVSALPPG